MALNIAVIGSGIAGLSAAWLLGQTHRVTLIEKAHRLGGHTNTQMVPTPDGDIAVDTGFIVYNEKNYPNLTAFFRHLDIETAHTDMSFAVSIGAGRREYAGENLNTLFGQRRNIVRPGHWRLIGDMLRFFRQATAQARLVPEDMSIGEFLKYFRYSQVFVDEHILPFSAAIWSTPARHMLDFPARTFIEFFANHGLLEGDIHRRPLWRTVRGGARNYVAALERSRAFRALPGANIRAVRRHEKGADIVFDNGHVMAVDQVVFACHADEALALIENPTADEQAVLGAFHFTPNHAVWHTDAAQMPRRKSLWSCWNYLSPAIGPDADLSVTYWMNRLQPLETKTDIFVTLNPSAPIDPETVVGEVTYTHPLFDAAALAAQRQMWRIQGAGNCWYAGAWLGYGFHEDGLQAGLEVAERIGPVSRPWRVTDERARIAHNWIEGDRAQWAAQ